MVIHLIAKGLYKVTMGTEVEPNSAVEKAKYFNRLDEAFWIIMSKNIERDIVPH